MEVNVSTRQSSSLHERAPRLALLDLGRFLAAFSVVFYHYFFNGIANGKLTSLTHIPVIAEPARYGYLGVEFFFMISGYVIFFSARGKSARQFAVSRATRLYPAFWFAVLFTSCVAYFWGGPRMSVSLEQMIANLTMMAPRLGYPYVDGVYWTLKLELDFYAAVTLLLLAGLRHRLDGVFLLWPIAIACADLANKWYWPCLSGEFSYFAAGALFALLSHQSPGRRGVVPWALLCLCFGQCLIFSCSQAPDLAYEKGVAHSPAVIAIMVTVFFIFFVAQNQPQIARLRLPGSRMLGALTYPIYLVHAHFGYMVLSRFANDENRLPAYAITLTCALGIAFFTHTVIERRPAGFWHSFFDATVGALFGFIEVSVLGRLRSAAARFSTIHVTRQSDS